MIPQPANIPQAPPFRMVENVISHDLSKTVCNFIPSEESTLSVNGYFTAEGLMECMAQTVAARAVLVNRTDPKIGYIAVIKSFQCTRLPKTGEEIFAEIELLHEVIKFQVLAARIIQHNEIIATCELRIFEGE